MANEINISFSVSCTKLGATVSGSSSLSQTLSGSNFQSVTQDIGTVEALTIAAEIAAGGWVRVKNLTDDVGGTVLVPTLTVSTANPATSTTTIAVLLPGEACPCKPGTNTLFGTSSSGNCAAQVLVIEP